MVEGIPTGVDEWIKFMKWVLNADPISSLQIAAVKKMNPASSYIVMRGIEFLSAVQQAKVECKDSRNRPDCEREVVERRTGVDYETVMNGLKNLSAVATFLRSLSPNAQYLVSRVTKYILLGERRNVNYQIGGWLGGKGFELSMLGRRPGRGEEEKL